MHLKDAFQGQKANSGVRSEMQKEVKRKNNLNKYGTHVINYIVYNGLKSQNKAKKC